MENYDEDVWLLDYRASLGRLSRLLIWKLRGLVGFANLSASINATINLSFYGNFRIFLSEINPVEYARLYFEWCRGSAPTETLRTRRGAGGSPQGLQLSVRRIRKFRLHLSAPAWLGSNDLVVPAGTTTAGERRNRNTPVKGAILRYFKRIRLSSAFQSDTYRCYGTLRMRLHWNRLGQLASLRIIFPFLFSFISLQF